MKRRSGNQPDSTCTFSSPHQTHSNMISDNIVVSEPVPTPKAAEAANVAATPAPAPAPIEPRPMIQAPPELIAMATRSPLLNPSPATRRPVSTLNVLSAGPTNDPPPAYTPNDTNTTTQPTITLNQQPSSDLGGNSNPNLLNPFYIPRSNSPTPSTITNSEDRYAFLSTFDTVLLIDDSGSMAGRSWRETRDALSQLLPIVVAHDSDGIDIYFLNHKSMDPGDLRHGAAPGGYRNVRTIGEVARIFNIVTPRGGTPTGTRLRSILRPYQTYLEECKKFGGPEKMDQVKPLNILCITDGVPSDDVESVILNSAKKLDQLEAAPSQVGIQFFQVGNEEGAKEALRELDDELQERGDCRDMVDTCTWMGGPGSGTEGRGGLTAEGMLKVVLGAVVKRLDRRRSGESRRGGA